MQFHLSDQKGWSLAPPRPHLRAESQGGRVSIWRSPLLEPFYKPRTWVSFLFHSSFGNVLISGGQSEVQAVIQQFPYKG